VEGRVEGDVQDAVSAVSAVPAVTV
jgi:hypothetical protein